LIPQNAYLLLSAALYLISLYCLAAKRNMIRLLIAVEIMVNAACINFVAFSSQGAPGVVDPLAQAFAVVSIAVGGCIAAVGLTIAFYAYRHYGTLDVRRLRRLRG